MTDLVEFKVRVPHRWICEAPRRTIRRIEAALRGHGVWRMEMFTEDSYQFSGQAPRSIVTLMMAMAQGHDVEAVLDMIERE